MNEVEDWLAQNPRERYVLDTYLLDRHQDFKDRLALWILKGCPDQNEMGSVLAAFVNAADRYEVAKGKQTFEDPPRFGMRRPHQVYIRGLWLSPVEDQRAFRCEFEALDGWSGYFHTKSAKVLSAIKSIPEGQPVTLVGEVLKRFTCFYVHFGGSINISR